MKKITIEMPIVSKCQINQCGYNVSNNCHAKAITIGDSTNPGCDTYMNSGSHNRETRRIAGVGACKVSSCKFNEDFECSAENISVGLNGKKINCLTYSPRAA
ncbi:MAG: DUF1540 domain-containing protein [Bdellovibrionota bacterium]